MTARYDHNRIAVESRLFRNSIRIGMVDFLEVYRLYVAEAGGDPEVVLDPQMFAQKHDIIVVPDS